VVRDQTKEGPGLLWESGSVARYGTPATGAPRHLTRRFLPLRPPPWIVDCYPGARPFPLIALQHLFRGTMWSQIQEGLASSRSRLLVSQCKRLKKKEKETAPRGVLLFSLDITPLPLIIAWTRSPEFWKETLAQPAVSVSAGSGTIDGTPKNWRYPFLTRYLLKRFATFITCLFPERIHWPSLQTTGISRVQSMTPESSMWSK